jgi:hypothetical protein
LRLLDTLGDTWLLPLASSDEEFAVALAEIERLRGELRFKLTVDEIEYLLRRLATRK